jgi:hypothetical protein
MRDSKLTVICSFILLAALAAGITGGGIYQGVGCVARGDASGEIYLVNRFTGAVYTGAK